MSSNAKFFDELLPSCVTESVKKDAMKELPEKLKQSIPQHVAIIMDGNGRWAQSHGKPRFYGHRAGVKAVRKTVSIAREIGVKSLTLFAFSSENWRRPDKEVELLMRLFFVVLQREIKLLNKNGVRLNIIGDISKFSSSLQKQISLAEEKTSANSDMVLNIAANYGGRWDVLQATKKLVQKVNTGEIAESDISESLLNAELCMSAQGEVDLMIRTGGDYRISNFILWQAAYAELIFMDLLWPDFNENAFLDAVNIFSSRQRRFGLTGGQIEKLSTQ